MNSSSHRIWIGRSGWLKPGDRRDQDEAEQGDVGRDQEDQALLDVVDDPPALRDAVDERRERVVAEHEVGGLLGDGRAAAHRDGDVGSVQRRGVVHAVAGDRDEAAARHARRARSARFCSGVAAPRRGDQADASASSSSDQAASSDPVTTVPRRAAACRAIAVAVAGWSPVTTTTWMPAACAASAASADPGPQRVGEADQRRPWRRPRARRVGRGRARACRPPSRPRSPHATRPRSEPSVVDDRVGDGLRRARAARSPGPPSRQVVGVDVRPAVRRRARPRARSRGPSARIRRLLPRPLDAGRR